MFLPTALNIKLKPSVNLLGASILAKVNTGSYWLMNETSGTRVDSVVAQGNDLTDNNTVGSAAGKVSANAASFIAANSEFLSHIQTSSLNVGNTSFTCFGWFWLDSKAATCALWNKFDSAINNSEYSMAYDQSIDRFKFRMFGTSFVDAVANSFGSPSTGTWYFIAGSVAADPVNLVSISVNAGTVNTTSKNFNNFPQAQGGTLKIGGSTGAFTSGRANGCGFFKGSGNAGLLSQEEVAYLYNNGNGRVYPFL